MVENCTPDGRLPDGDKGADHIRKIFYRMGFGDDVR
jgi:cytochrome c peroxidase